MTEKEQNYGDKADEILKHLTQIEDRYHDVQNGHEMTARQMLDFKDAIEAAQSRANEIIDRYEENNGPINPVHKE